MNEPASFCNGFRIDKTLDAIIIHFYFQDPNSPDEPTGQQFLLKKIALPLTTAELLRKQFSEILDARNPGS